MSIISFAVNAKSICSRVATINYQEVLVDLSNTQKGEGLKFYLNQDKISKEYLRIYQENTSRKWQNAATGAVATLTILAGVSTSDNILRRNLFISGASLFIINYLVAKTMLHSNEKNLQKSISEYNKRNLPKIYMGKEKNKKGNNFYIEQKWKF